jgi:hypothetical protein
MRRQYGAQSGSGSDEFARVVKPGGEIGLLNRVGADAGPRRLFEHLFQPVAKKLGWRSEFPWGRFARWAASTPHGIHLIERRPMPPLGHFSLIRFGKAGTGAGADRLAVVSGGVIPTVLQHHFQLTTSGLSNLGHVQPYQELVHRPHHAGMRVEGAARKANIHGTVVALTLHELSAAAHHADRDEDIAVERTDLGRHTFV